MRTFAEGTNNPADRTVLRASILLQRRYAMQLPRILSRPLRDERHNLGSDVYLTDIQSPAYTPRGGDWTFRPF